MRPAFSVIFFSVLSGAGYGLLACAAMAAMFAPMCMKPPCAPLAAGDPAQPGFLVAATMFAVVLVVAGLGSSVLHLGRPLRAWRAFSQWRSSWLSREGVSAVASLLAAVVFLSLLGSDPAGWSARFAGVASLVLAVTTVFCTARIYTSLPPIPAWRHDYVLPGYLLFAATTGLALWIATSRFLVGDVSMFAAILLALLALVTGALKWRYWRDIDAIAMPGTARMTGLDSIGVARSFEAPHTEANYLTKEMGFRFARRHARFLRASVLVSLLGTATIALCVLTIPGLAATPLESSLPAGHGAGALANAGTILLIVAALLTLLAALVERWLFFAQARHMVMAYYQR